MAAKKKKKLDPEFLYSQDEIMISLKERYFKLLKTEDIPKTPQLTSTIDKLELAIKQRKEEILDDQNA
jgi:hypothetical protein